MDLTDEQKVGLKPFGTKVFERMRFEKTIVFVERVVRHLYVKDDTLDPDRSPIVAAPTLPSIVEGCKYDFSVIAAIVGMKFAFHMPTYREQEFFGQSGWYPSRSTCNDLINYAVDCIEPLFDQMTQCLMSQPIVLGDATVLTVLLREAPSDTFLKLSLASQHNPQDLKLGSPLQMSLLPDRWAANHPEHVHHERIAEKRLSAEDKLFYRLQSGLTGTHPYAAAPSLSELQVRQEH